MLQGSLDNFGLDEVLSMLSTTKKTGCLSVSGDRGTGSLWLDDGGIVASEASNLAGDTPSDDVLFELLRFETGSFLFTMDEAAVSPGIAESIDLLLESSKERITEWRSIAEVVPSLDHELWLVSTIEDDEVTLSSEEWDVIVAIGRGNKVGYVCDQVNLGEIDGSRRIKDMVERGLVEISEPVTQLSDSTSFESAINSPAGMGTYDDPSVDAFAETVAVEPMVAEPMMGEPAVLETVSLPDEHSMAEPLTVEAMPPVEPTMAPVEPAMATEPVTVPQPIPTPEVVFDAGSVPEAPMAPSPFDALPDVPVPAAAATPLAAESDALDQFVAVEAAVEQTPDQWSGMAEAELPARPSEAVFDAAPASESTPASNPVEAIDAPVHLPPGFQAALAEVEHGGPIERSVVPSGAPGVAAAAPVDMGGIPPMPAPPSFDETSNPGNRADDRLPPPPAPSAESAVIDPDDEASLLMRYLKSDSPKA